MGPNNERKKGLRRLASDIKYNLVLFQHLSVQRSSWGRWKQILPLSRTTKCGFAPSLTSCQNERIPSCSLTTEEKETSLLSVWGTRDGDTWCFQWTNIDCRTDRDCLYVDNNLFELVYGNSDNSANATCYLPRSVDQHESLKSPKERSSLIAVKLAAPDSRLWDESESSILAHLTTEKCENPSSREKKCLASIGWASPEGRLIKLASGLTASVDTCGSCFVGSAGMLHYI